MVQFIPSSVITVFLALSYLVSTVSGTSWLDWVPPVNNSIQAVNILPNSIDAFLNQTQDSTGAINAAVTVADDLLLLGASMNVAAETAEALLLEIGLPSGNDTAGILIVCSALQRLGSQSISILGNNFTSSKVFAAFKASPIFPSIQESLSQLNATYSAFDSTWVFVAPAGPRKSTALDVTADVDRVFAAVRALYAF